MRRVRRTTALLVLVSTLLAGTVATAGIAQERSEDEIARDLQDARSRREQERTSSSNLGARVADAQRQLSALRVALDEARARLRVAEGQLALAETALSDAEAARETARDNLGLAERLLAQSEEQLAGEESDLGQQVATAYKYGSARGAMYLEVIRSARTPNDVAVGLYHLGSVIDYQDAVVTRIERMKADREVLRDRADRTRAEAERREADAAMTLEVVARLREDARWLAESVANDEARQAVILASLEADAATQRAVLAQVEAEAEALAAELEEARKRRAATSGFTCPVVPSWFQNDWGFPRSGGRTHEGTDVFADRGTPVVAVAGGTVKAVDRTDRYQPGTSAGDLGGLSVSYWTAPGEYWYFSHLEAIADGIEPGVVVAPGQVIGYVGNSGNARTTPPHTHVGRYIGGKATNPYPALAESC